MRRRSDNLIRRAFIMGLGFVYLCAFLSLWVQLEGLVGHDGILPAEPFMKGAADQLGTRGFLRLPTLFWWTPPRDALLNATAATGAGLSVLLILGIAPTLTSLLLWLAYLSLYAVCRTFLSFQWDILLLEMGCLAIFYSPPLAWLPRSPRWAVSPSSITTWTLRLLTFKLMFSSGVVKLTSNDPTWWNLTALAVHYETTCLPTWTGWYAHQLPLWFHKGSALMMFVIELVLPFLIFGPRRGRLIAAAGFASLMLFIAATGNYGFFNLQGLVLCLPLLDDEVLPATWRARVERVFRGPTPAAPERIRGGNWPAVVTLPLAGLITLLTVIPLGRAFRVRVDWPASLVRAYDWQRPFHIVNGYGLFARMTTERPEIIIEGSNDQRRWRAYEFRWKPGDPMRRPRFVQPHMPRVDWRMWFAALGSARGEGWFYPFCKRILEGSPAVLALLEKNPFEGRPPRYLRALLYDYRFTRSADDAAGAPTIGGAWWRREFLRPYTPVLFLADDPSRSLRAVRSR